MDDIKIKKGTTTVGIVCKNGIVLAADKRASAGYMIASKEIDKVFPIYDNMAMTIAGLVSDAQLITKIIKAELRLKAIRTNKEPTVKETANMLASLSYSNIRRPSMVPGIVGFLLGGKDSNSGFNLYEIGIDGSITKCSKFCSDGSGMELAIGVFETLYKEDMTVDEGVKLAVQAINAAIQRNIATGDGIDVYAITDKGVNKVYAKKISYKIT